ncbi:hypothetical protein B9Z19DRAFT_1068053 [Tuber borchii]|uniref:Uncharacterized protein n=1 Tax=Tuber borchii TaxID=42251 RepID=A0A2T6ZGN5_TUBBO|nr:hypothetical protein B9Z19DRAFT_1068053 [Tuber borchii]
MAPSGDYARLTFEHVENCKCGDEASDDHIRMIIRNGGFETFEQVEAAIRDILLTRGCFECRLDRKSTLGIPSSGNINRGHPDQASVSWPSVANDSQSAQRVPADDALQANSQSSSSYYGSGLPSSIMRHVSPGEQRIYGPRFQLNHA